MGTLELLLAIFVILGVVRFVFKSIKTVANILLTVVVVGVVLHFLAPEKLDSLIGKDVHEKGVEIFEKGKEAAGEMVDIAVDSVKETAKNKKDELTGKE